MKSNSSLAARIVILLPIDYIGEEKEETGFEILKYPMLSKLCSTLIREGVHEILVPDFYTWQLNNLPEILRPRIRIIDRNKRVLTKVGRFFKPITDDVCHEYGVSDEAFNPLVSSFNAFYTLSLAAMEQAFSGEVLPDIQNLRELRGLVKNDEAMARIDLLESIRNSYTSTSAYILETIPSNISISERLQDFFEDSEVISLQKSRYLMGLPGKIKGALVQTKRWVHRIADKPIYKDFVKAGTEIINLFSIESSTQLQLTRLIETERLKYNPPVINNVYIYEKFIPTGTVPLFTTPLDYLDLI